MSYNKIIIVGHLGRDPELTTEKWRDGKGDDHEDTRYTQAGKPVCNFTVAT